MTSWLMDQAMDESFLPASTPDPVLLEHAIGGPLGDPNCGMEEAEKLAGPAGLAMPQFTPDSIVDGPFEHPWHDADPMTQGLFNQATGEVSPEVPVGDSPLMDQGISDPFARPQYMEEQHEEHFGPVGMSMPQFAPDSITDGPFEHPWHDADPMTQRHLAHALSQSPDGHIMSGSLPEEAGGFGMMQDPYEQEFNPGLEALVEEPMPQDPLTMQQQYFDQQMQLMDPFMMPGFGPMGPMG